MHHILLVFLTVVLMVAWFYGSEWWALGLLIISIALYTFMPRWDDH